MQQWEGHVRIGHLAALQILSITLNGHLASATYVSGFALTILRQKGTKGPEKETVLHAHRLTIVKH